MKKFTFLSVIFVFSTVVLLTGVALAQRGGIEHRIRHQWHRIDRAVAAGRLAQWQADSLHRHLRDIRSQFEEARDNGTLDFDTIHRLNRELDRNSRRIERMANGEGGMQRGGMQQGGIEHRIRHQWQRIDRAAADGRLAQWQADSLHRHLRDIRSQFENARDNGTLDFDTIHRLNRELDRNSRRIERMANRGGGVNIGPLHLHIH